MSKVIVDLGISVDGFVAGPNARPGNPLGDGGLDIHRWVFQTAGFVRNLGLKGSGRPDPTTISSRP